MTINIGTRIIIGFLVVLSLMAGLAVYQLVAMGQLRASINDILESNLATTRLIGEATASEQGMRGQTERAIALHFMASQNPGTRSPRVAQQNWQLRQAATKGALEQLIALSDKRESEAKYLANEARWKKIAIDAAQARTTLKENTQIVATVFDALNSGQVGKLEERLQVLNENRQRFSDAMGKLKADVDQSARAAKATVNQTYQDVRQIFMFALGAAIVATFCAIWLLHRTIAPPLAELVASVERVGRGDLTRRVRDFGSDEMGRLGRQINEMIENLTRTTRQTLAAVTNVTGATSQLEASAAQQAASANQQRAAVQEITSTLSEIAQSGSQISERAKEVASSSEMTLSASEAGLEAVDETSGIMSKIGEQSETVATNIVSLTEKTRSIGDIITTVNDIAERSDLLALNAAIEASAAGEEGRSFAVVADEMKNLAAQAKEATGQVQTLLNDIQQGIATCVMQTEESVKRTELGKQQSAKLKESIERLAESINVNVQAFEQIIAGTNQQQIGVEQVTQAIKEISSASGEVAEGTRGLQGAAVSLNALSAQLRSSVEGYVVA